MNTRLSLMTVVLAVSIASCSAPQRAQMVRSDSNIVRVVTFCRNNPFVSFNAAADRTPEGMRVTYYAISGKTQEGANADGTIRFKLFTVKSARGYKPVSTLR